MKKIYIFLLSTYAIFFANDSLSQCTAGQNQIMTDGCAAATAGWTFTNGTTTTAIQQATGYWLVEKTADVITSPNYTVNGTITVRFQTATFGTVGTGPNTLIAEYNTGSGWTSLSNTANPTSATYVNSALTIPGVISSSTFQIRFRNTASTAPGIRLDNIYICETPASSLSGVTSGSGTEPTSISSLITAQSGAVSPQLDAVLNFDFLVTDDANIASGNDALPTLITQIVIPQGTGNTVTTWTDLIAGAQLSDGTNTMTGTVNAANITFSSIPTSSGALGEITDASGTKTYTLKIWLKTTPINGLPTTMDGMALAFKIDRTNFTTASSATSTQFESGAGTVVQSGSETVTVVASKLVFVQNTSDVDVNAAMSPAVTISATDANGNRDLGYTSSITMSQSGSAFAAGATTNVSASSGLASFSNLKFSSANTGVTISASDGVITGTGNSNLFTVRSLLPEINITGNSISIVDGDITPSATDYTDFGSINWGNTFDRTFTIQNTGTGALTLGVGGVAPYVSITGSGDFTVLTAPPSNTIAAGGSATFVVRFTPSSTGLKSATINIYNNDADESTYDYAIQGTGLPSNLSTIIANAAYTYNSDIPYIQYQNSSITNSTSNNIDPTLNSIDIFKFDIKDGASDADNLPTILSSITFNVTNVSNILTAALFNGNTMVANVPTISTGSGTIAFSGMSYSTLTDGGTASLTLRVSFNKSTVVDNQQMQVTISNANVTTAGSSTSSSFSAFTSVISSTTGTINQIEVTATKLKFIQQPVSSVTNAVMSPSPTVATVDANDVKDLDITTGSVQIYSSGTLSSSPQTATPSAGLATFTNIVHTTASSPTYVLTAKYTGLTDATSNAFVVSNFSYAANDFMPKYATDLSYNGDWLWYNGSSFVDVPDGKAPQNTSTTVGRILINAYVTGGGSTTHTYPSDIIIFSGGKLVFSANDAPPVASEIISASKKIEVLSGGSLIVQGDIDLPSTGSLIVRSGGSMTLDQASVGNTHPMWDGTELFEGGSSVTINDWDFAGSATVASLLNVSASISSNANGYKFGNLIIDINPSTTWTLIGGPLGTINLCENNLDIDNASSNAIYGATNATGSNGFVVNGNMTIYDGPFSFGASFSTSAFTHQFTINGNFECASNDALKMHTSSSTPSSLAGYVTVKGNFLVDNTVTTFNSDKATDNSVVGLRLNGTGSTQLLSVYPTVIGVPITVKSNALVQLSNTDLVLNSLTSVTANFSVEANATLDFNFNGSTPLVIKKVTTGQAGTNTFTTADLSTLKITAPDGINLAAGTTGATSQPLNVQMNTASTVGTNSTFWYMGKTNQHTGTCIGTSSTGRQVIVDLTNNSTTLIPDVLFGLTDATTISSTGGKLDIRKGQFIETATGGVSSSTGGTLYMSDGTLYQIPTASTSTADLIPRMSGTTFAYSLNGTSTIELNAAGDQILRGLRDYRNLTFSTSGTKTVSSAPSSITGTVKVTNTAILDVAANSFGGTNTNLNMDGGRFKLSGLNTKPDIDGTYTLTGGVIEFYNSQSTRQTIKGQNAATTPIVYNQIEVSGTNVGNSNATILLNATAGKFTVNNGGIYYASDISIKSNATSNTSSVVVENGGLFNTSSNEGFSGFTTTTIPAANSSIHSNIASSNITLKPGSTVDYNGTGAQNITNQIPYQNFAISGVSGIKTAPSGTLTVKQNLTKSGSSTFEANGGLVLMDSADQNFAGLPYNSIRFSTYSGIGSSTKTLTGNASIIDSLGIGGINTTLALNNNSLSLLSTSTKTARVAQLPLSATITYGSTGKFFVHRYLPARRAWRLMSPPISAVGASTARISEAWQELNGITGSDHSVGNSAADTSVSFYATLITGGAGKTTADGFDLALAGTKASILKYDKVSSGTWKVPDNTNNTLVNSERGWMVFVRGDRATYGRIDNASHTPTITTLRPRGQITIGDVRIPTTGTLSGMQVVNNPYASSLNFHTATKTGDVTDQYYIWDPYMGGSKGVGAFILLSSWSGGAYTRSAPLTGTGTSSIDNQYIPSGAAILVDFGMGGSITFHESDKASSSTTTAYRPVRNISTTLNGLEADGSTFLVDGVVNLFNENYNKAVDKFDGKKAPAFEGENFSTKRDSILLSIEQTQLPDTKDTIFYNWSKIKVRDYQLNITSDSIDNSWIKLYLEDHYKKTKTEVDPSDVFKYNFQIVQTDSGTFKANRFNLILENNPPKILGITASQQYNDVLVQWKVNNEQGIQQYIVERSVDGDNFIAIKTVDASSGNINSYDLLDIRPQIGDNFYRIRSLNDNGRASLYSEVVKISIAKPGINIYPNPITNGEVGVQLTNMPKGQYILSLRNSLGQLLQTKKADYEGGSRSVNIALDLVKTRGVYQVEIIKPDKTRETIKVIY